MSHSIVKLKFKIIFPILFSFILLEVATLAVCYNKTREALRTELTSKGEVLASALAYNCQNLSSLDPSTVQGFVDEYLKMKDVDYVFVQNEHNDFIAYTFTPGIPIEFRQVTPISENSGTSSRLMSYHGEETIDIAAPIMSGLLGNVHIGLNLERAVKIASIEIFKVVFWISLPIMLGGILFLYYSIQKITEELEFSHRQTQNNLEELSKTREALIASAKMSALGEMAGGVAHEINNPLAIIKLKVEQIGDLAVAGELDSKYIANSIEVINRTIHRIAKIINGLKSFARDGNSDPVLNASVSSIIEETLSFCFERFKSNGVPLQIDFPKKAEGDDLSIECRATEISQVLLNLLNNSFDATQSEKNPWVTLQILEQTETVEISVTDSGPGIPIEVQKKMLQPFFTTKPVGKGTGLGLSISKGIIESHHGKLFVDNNCKNTKFVIVLPKHQPLAIDTRKRAA